MEMDRPEAAALEGSALDLAVAQALRLSPETNDGIVSVDGVRFAPSRDWADGGPLIERFRMRIHVLELSWGRGQALWAAEFPGFGFETEGFAHGWSTGPNPLLAAMRALVAARALHRTTAASEDDWNEAGRREIMALLVELVRRAGIRCPATPMRLQRLVDRLQQAGVDLGYGFIERPYGQYCEALAGDLARLAALGILRLKREAAGVSSYMPGSEAADFVAAARAYVDRHRQALDALLHDGADDA
ncbi:phage protein NinX family protein [Acidihalobacter prosperus]|uniref:Uncharacterized protein n=1 Tax=Acidihalobacter prosperus TaxID=160660 RepID=A0A1A6C1V0_9GAMM|nr:phage protein NinX family protein [Acidihalobacter prosperus]OBS08533.1 hypothetical protein Thpro_022783 [Acidihalobacter prosperus]